MKEEEAHNDYKLKQIRKIYNILIYLCICIVDEYIYIFILKINQLEQKQKTNEERQ